MIKVRPTRRALEFAPATSHASPRCSAADDVTMETYYYYYRQSGFTASQDATPRVYLCQKITLAHTRLPSVGFRSVELIPVLGSQPAGDVSHKPGGRL